MPAGQIEKVKLGRTDRGTAVLNIGPRYLRFRGGPVIHLARTMRADVHDNRSIT